MVTGAKNSAAIKSPHHSALPTRKSPTQTHPDRRNSAAHWNWARFYHAELGRFISRDPVGYVDGMNLYRAYFVALGVDPSGLDTLGNPVFVDRPVEFPFGRPGTGVKPNVRPWIVPKIVTPIFVFIEIVTSATPLGNAECYPPPPKPPYGPQPPNNCQKKWGYELCPSPAKTKRTEIESWLPGKINVDPSYSPVVTNCKISVSQLRPGACPSGGWQEHCTIWFVSPNGWAKPQVRIEVSVFVCNCCHSNKRGTYAKGAHWSDATETKYGGLPTPHTPITPILIDYNPYGS